MSNLLKSGFVTFQEDKKRVIDSNELVAKRLGGLVFRSSEIQETSREDALESAESRMDADTEKALFGDGSGTASQEEPVYDGPSPEELIEAARQEIEEMKASARQEIEQMQERAYEEARAQGYNDGYEQGQVKAREEAEAAAAETERLRQKLRADYENTMQELEPAVIDALTDIYDHVFEAGLKEKKEIIFHLLDTTLHHIDSGREFILRVSHEDYGYVSGRKEAFLERMGNITLDIVEDAVLKQGDGLIETGGGLFDCSIDVELKELKERIRTLAYQN